MLLLLFGLDVLERRGPGQKLVFDVKCSQARARGIRGAPAVEPIMWKTGHSLIKKKMKEDGGADRGRAVGPHLLSRRLLWVRRRALRRLPLWRNCCAQLGRPAIPAGGRVPAIRFDAGDCAWKSTEERKFGIVASAVEPLPSTYPTSWTWTACAYCSTDGWGLLRASNTQPVLVARFEARTPERLRRSARVMGDWLAGEGVQLDERDQATPTRSSRHGGRAGTAAGVRRGAARLYTDALWFDELGLSSVFTARIMAVAVVRLVGGVVGVALVLGNLGVVARRLGPVHVRRRYGNLEIAEHVPRRVVLGLAFAWRPWPAGGSPLSSSGPTAGWPCWRGSAAPGGGSGTRSSGTI